MLRVNFVEHSNPYQGQASNCFQNCVAKKEDQEKKMTVELEEFMERMVST